jgi:stage III sporulation protein AE
LSAQTAVAGEIDQSLLDSQMELIDFSALEEAIGQSSGGEDISIQDLTMKAIAGELDLSPAGILQVIADQFAGEFVSLVSMLRNMILLAMFGALLNNLSLSLKQKEVSELGFYICYIAMILLLMASFQICISVMQTLINDLCMIMQSAIPMMVTLAAMSGNVTSAFAFHPVTIVMINLLSGLIRDYVVPVVIFAATLQMINFISEKDVLQRLASLIKSSVSWFLKLIASVFIAILMIQGVSAPIMNNVITRSAKATINIVPVVGQALTSAVDTVIFWSNAVKSGVMIAIIIVIVLMCSVPIIKLITFVMVFKLTAAIIQPISDPRIVKATDALGSFTAILVGACVTVAIMFVFITMVILAH